MNIVAHHLQFTMEEGPVRQAIVSAAKRFGYKLTFGPGEFDLKVTPPDAGKAFDYGAACMRVYMENGGTFDGSVGLVPRAIRLREDT